MADQIVDISDVTRMFQGFEKRAANLKPVFKEVRREIDLELREHFADRAGPDGPWPDWSASTVEKFLGWRNSKGRRENVFNRGKRKGQLNRRGTKRRTNILGRLKSAWVFLIDGASLIVQSRVPWSGVHQEGGRAGRGGRSAIPARPFMWMSPELVGRIKKRLIDYVTRGNW